jgi:antitoxin component of MazEF toxin-antitoxin module
MRKEIKQWGDSAVIVFTKEDLRLYNLQVGDIVELDDMVKIQKEGKKK